VRHLIDTACGLYELARLFVISRGRMRGAYWSWRRSTAMGDGSTLSPAQRKSAILEYARWIRRMRRMM